MSRMREMGKHRSDGRTASSALILCLDLVEIVEPVRSRAFGVASLEALGPVVVVIPASMVLVLMTAGDAI